MEAPCARKSLLLFLVLLSEISLLYGQFPFRNTSLPIDQRVADLVSRLTLDEIAGQMAGGGGGGFSGGNPSPAIPRLGIGKFVWSVECLRGDGMAGNATSFPQALGLAATFSRSTMYQVANATATEVRAKNNDFVKRGIFKDHTGLGCWSPVVNIMRHPLWGRNQETYGEDPYLTGELATQFVKGLQGNHPRYIATAATCKHFDAYGGPEDIPVSRLSFNANVTEFDLRMTFTPQFKACVDAGAVGIMCSYNSVNGIPACLNKHLLTDVLRTDWKFPGYVVSDAGALEFAIFWHSYLPTFNQTAAAAIKAGLNLELAPTNTSSTVFGNISSAVKYGLVNESTVRESSKPIFAARMMLGNFDPAYMNPYTKLNLSVIQSKAHQNLSIRAAQESLVLLKNDGLLPLKGRRSSSGLIGPMCDNLVQIMGDYSADVDEIMIVDVVEGVQLSNAMSFTSGCDNTKCNTYYPDPVKDVATSNDIIVLCLGTGQLVEAENFDRPDMYLPGKQKQLLQDVIDLAVSPIILLLFSGGPLDITPAIQSEKVSAIIQCFFPAQGTGRALQSVLIQETPFFNPAGRLPFTWYLSQAQVPNMTDYSMTNKTYRYYTGKPLYPFGYGLSYSTFKYNGFVIDPVRVRAGSDVSVKFNVTNEGPFDGDEVVQVYMSWQNSSVAAPNIQLVGFDQVHLQKGAALDFKFIIKAQQMAVWVQNKGFVVEPGNMTLYTGHQPPTFSMNRTEPGVLQGNFTVY